MNQRSRGAGFSGAASRRHPRQSAPGGPPPRDATHAFALPDGYRLRCYRIESLLGQGGFGITYLATDTRLDRVVAIKEYAPLDCAVRDAGHRVRPRGADCSRRYAENLARFVAEAHTLARFNHHNIVCVYSLFRANDTAYLVMEYQPGRSFRELLGCDGHCREPTLLAMLRAVLDGLGHIHAAGFVHGDIKPDNLYIRANGEPLLLDFGSATRARRPLDHEQTGFASPCYAAYEQYCGARLGPWTDVYGLGASLYRAVTGRPPESAPTRRRAILEGRRDPLAPAASLAPAGYTAAFLTAIDASLGFLPTARPQSVAAWWRMFPQPTGQTSTAKPAGGRSLAAPPPRNGTPAAATSRSRAQRAVTARTPSLRRSQGATERHAPARAPVRSAERILRACMAATLVLVSSSVYLYKRLARTRQAIQSPAAAASPAGMTRAPPQAHAALGR